MHLRTSYLMFLFLTFYLSNIAIAQDRETLVGTWVITQFYDDGRDRLQRIGYRPASGNQKARLAKLVFTKSDCYLIRGDGRRELANGLTNAGFKSVSIDEKQNPKSMDIIGFAGSENEKTKTYPAIYKFEKDKLFICWAEQGKTRPTEFKSDGTNNLIECYRESKEPIPLPDTK